MSAEKLVPRLTIDLSALAANYRLLQSMLAPGCAAAGVVKADAYGLGAQQAVAALWDAGCRFFYVATVDEALIVRAALDEMEADAPVAVLSGVVADAGIYRAARLTPVLNHEGDLARWPADVPAILHIDTGMNRLGFAARDAHLALGRALSFVMSHYACADEPGHPMNARQLAAFRAVVADFSGVPASFANSSGIFLGPETHFQQARPGCALYGVNPVPGRSNPMRAVARLEVPILQIRDVSAGESVGYGGGHVFSASARLATVAFGYADGYFRSLGNGRGHLRASGDLLPVAGRVSMDLVSLDVSSRPDLKPGDYVTVLDEAHTVDDVAAEAGTIGYEVLTALGRRYARTYRR